MRLLDRLIRRFARSATPPLDPTLLPNEGAAPEFRGLQPLAGADGSPAVPLTIAGLRGRVVLVSFWTYSCVNCVRSLPAVKRWHERYAEAGLTVIGIHTPEFDFEHDAENVRAAVTRLGVPYAVALDNDYATWNAYKNRYWPAHYFVDASGNVRHHHFGEGAYEEQEAVIRVLLAEAGAAVAAPSAGPLPPEPPMATGLTQETYFGFEHAENLGSPESVVKNLVTKFSAPRSYAPNIYYLEGAWEIRDGYAVPMKAGARLIYKVNAASCHAVLQSEEPGGGRVRVTVDDGSVTVLDVREGRVYPLFETWATGEHLLRMEFLDHGTRCYSMAFA